MTRLPTGTVTLLFSDVEGSTRLLTRLGQHYVQALEGHRVILRRAWTQHEGLELGTEGDSFFVAFPLAAGAVHAAVQAQRELGSHAWPFEGGVRVRIGIHTGAPMRHGDGYVGLDVHRAARVAAVARGGQILVSDATAGLLPRGEDLQLVDLGWHVLKDLPAPEHLFQVVAPGLIEDFGPVPSLGSAAGVPETATSLEGRTTDLTRLEEMLGQPGLRLLTLTGPGGAGKTRLATALARRTAGRYAHGVFFVPCEAARDEEQMWTAIAVQLAVPAERRLPPALFPYIAHRSSLLVLDNLEQIRAASSVVGELLAAAPSLRIIATSRHPLHLPGEQEYPVGPLALPVSTEPAEVERSPAVALLVNRARSVNPGFAVTEGNRAAVISLCTTLDGLPLALELAAARLKFLTPSALLARLGDALDLSSSATSRPDRQATIRRTLQWSYELLGEAERRLLRCLSVFVGGAALDMVEALWSRVGDPRDDVLHLLEELVDASLVTVADGDDGEPRLTMLNTVRAFAAQELARGEDALPARDAMAELVDELMHRYQLDRSPGWRNRYTTRLEVELDNCRATLSWLTTGGQPSTTARVSKALDLTWRLAFWFLNLRGHHAEARDWCESVLALAGDRRGPRVAACQAELSWSRLRLGAVPEAVSLTAIARANWSTPCEADRDLNESASELMRFSVVQCRAAALTADGAGNAGRRLLEHLLGATREPTLRVVVLQELCLAHLEAGAPEVALTAAVESLDVAEALGDELLWLWGLHKLALVHMALGNAAEAERGMRTAARRYLAVADADDALRFARDYAGVLSELGRSQDAHRLRDAVMAAEEGIQEPHPPLVSRGSSSPGASHSATPVLPEHAGLRTLHQVIWSVTSEA